ncbi:MAG: tetratricopeptide repeat protein [Caulobacteraceae bacterium]|nr:tetratricopeptide repeat protein [Caulobacteraceae bacterium]
MSWKTLAPLTLAATLMSAACAPTPPGAVVATALAGAHREAAAAQARRAAATSKMAAVRPLRLHRTLDWAIMGPAVAPTALDEALYAPVQSEALRSAGLLQLARLHLEAGRPEAAASAAKAAHELARGAYGPNHVESVSSLSDLGDALFAAGRPDEARAALVEATLRSAAALGPDHPTTREAQRRLAARPGPQTLRPWLRNLNRQLGLRS